MKIQLNRVIKTLGIDLISNQYIKRVTNNQLKLPPNFSLTIFGKIFGKIIFNKFYQFLLGERLLNPNQSGFCPSDSCMNQLLSITHNIFEAFDSNPPLKVRSVFPDISKAFEKVCHEGHIHGIKIYQELQLESFTSWWYKHPNKELP